MLVPEAGSSLIFVAFVLKVLFAVFLSQWYYWNSGHSYFILQHSFVDVVPLIKTACVVENSGHCIYSIGLKCLRNFLSLFHLVFYLLQSNTRYFVNHLERFAYHYIYIYSVILLIVQLIPLHNIAAFISICRFLNQCC